MIAAGGIKRLAAALVMFGAVVWFGTLRGPGPLTTAVQVAGGACVYFVMLLILGIRRCWGRFAGYSEMVLERFRRGGGWTWRRENFTGRKCAADSR